MAGISTHGWDIVYAMRFSAVNTEIEKTVFAEKKSKGRLRKGYFID